MLAIVVCVLISIREIALCSLYVQYVGKMKLFHLPSVHCVEEMHNVLSPQCTSSVHMTVTGNIKTIWSSLEWEGEPLIPS